MPKTGPPLPPDDRRCSHVRKDGTRCKNWAMFGVAVCGTPSHGGSLPNVRLGSKRAKALALVTSAAKFAQPVSEEHVSANPVTGLLWEIRRTAGLIIYYEEQVAKLRDEEHGFGITKEEQKDAPRLPSQGGVTDASYVLEVREARINTTVLLYQGERKHYAGLCATAIKAGLEERRIRMQETVLVALQGVITNVISNLGGDPNDPETRQMVRTELLAADVAA